MPETPGPDRGDRSPDRHERADTGVYCAVCGYENEEPWGESGDSPDFTFCPCCGVEAGYEDSSNWAADNFWARWLTAGAPWFRRRRPQDGLDTATRLARVRPDLARELMD